MRAIILAAGRGTRISRMIEAVPKCTLPVDGVPLIRRTVSMLADMGIEAALCVGYKPKKIYDALEGLSVKFYLNPFYDITNSIASLWLTRPEIKGDMLIMNGDVFFTETLMHRLINSEHDVCMAIDKSRAAVGDYFFSTTGKGTIEKYGKDLPLEVRSCEYVGMAKIDGNFTPSFVNRLDELIGIGNKHNLWWEDVLYSFTDKREKDIYTMDVSGEFWAEIDYFDDYQRILGYIAKREEEGCM